MDLYMFLNCLFIYSFGGWLFECVLLSVQQKKMITDRGIMQGPFCPVYAAGALSLYLIFNPFRDNVWLIFVGGMALATAIEYITAVIMIKMFGFLWWNYDDKPFNYKGIICLEGTVSWGVLAVLTLRVFQPAVEKFINLYSFGSGRMLVYIMAFVYFSDLSASLYWAKKSIGKGSKPKNLNGKEVDKRAF